MVGHQSSGKSALIEALMGFQFNQVGGGTKTRRPVALRLQYNKRCHTPRWYLVGDDGVERSMTLEEVQMYIDQENKRLERDPNRSFDSKEINLRMEYKHCPNMILIDTPGLISAPRVPKGQAGEQVAQQRALQASAREAEKLVVEKMKCKDYIILCVEDTSDWKHGVTREVVQKADPDLSRTVIVNTKFDTKAPQFGSPSDVEEFVRAPILNTVAPHKLGGPFFTSVPSGRVGRGNDAHDSLFMSDDEFVRACDDAENSDRALVISRLQKLGKAREATSSGTINRIGLANLKSFLEAKVDETYRRNVRKIIPMLQTEYSATQRRLKSVEKELEALSIERLRSGADAFCDDFCACLRKTLQGSIVAPVSLFGETLQQETSVAGSFHDVSGSPMAVSDRTWDRLVDAEVGNRDHRLYGGSQYHRTLREFHLATRCLRLPAMTEDEIANAAGLGETHDGVNFLHAACTIAIEKARVSFEPMLNALQHRMSHVMERLYPVSEYMLRENRDRQRARTLKRASVLDEKESVESVMDIAQSPQFRKLIQNIFNKFVNDCSEQAMTRCRDDLTAITRYVAWNLDDRGSGALSRALPDQTDTVSVYQVALRAARGEREEEEIEEDKPQKKNNRRDKRRGKNKEDDEEKSGAIANAKPLQPQRRGVDRDYQNLLQLMEEALMSRDSDRTNLVVGALVQHIVTSWRESFCKSVITKFNCYFMLPFVDEFNRYVRKELRLLYEGEGDAFTDVFDLTSVRKSLQQHRDQLVNECIANKRLQEKFQVCARFLNENSNR